MRLRKPNVQIPTINHLRNEKTTAWIGVWVRVSVRASVSCGCFSASGSISSCQPVVMATLRSRLRVSSLLLLPGSTDLFSSAPFCCAQPLQLTGNGGWRQGSAAPLSWTSLRPCNSQPLQLLTCLGARETFTSLEVFTQRRPR